MFGAKVRAVATDMSPAYILAVHDNLPKAVHVFDRFHVMKLFNEKLADLRRDVQQSVEVVEHRKLLKGTLWLLLKNPENLDPRKHERQQNAGRAGLASAHKESRKFFILRLF